ncbi:substrate-binding domain-containing protein [Nocardiopsis oceani]
MLCHCPEHGERQRTDDFPVGVVIPLRGPAGIFGPSCEAVTETALEQINSAGGLLGRRLRPVVIDGGQPVRDVAAQVSALTRSGDIHAVTGWHISQVRQHLVPVVRDHVPYVYTSLYEGGENSTGVFCSGETPPDQIAPAMRWMRDEQGARDLFVVGDDYVWPRSTARSIHAYAHELGMRVVGESFVELGTEDFGPTLDLVRGSDADTVLMLLVGQDAVAFNRLFAAYGLQERVRRLTPLMEENMLLGSGADSTAGLYVAAAYFRSLPTESALDLSGAYTRMHGPDAPPLNNMAESCYEGLMALDALVHRAGTTRPELLSKVGDSVGYDGPRGAMQLRSGNVHQRVYMARAEGLGFEILDRL